MGNIGTAMSQTIPAVGASGTQYATDIDAFLTEVKVRLVALVPRASLAPGALDMANNSVQNASYIGLQAGVGAPTTPAGTLQTFAGNLYWVTNSGAAQITSGNALNTASVGAITGDYGGVNPAQFRFVAADLEYYAYTNYAGGTWAKLWTNGLDVASGATSANRARITYGGAGSYGLVLPPSLPASSKLMQVSSAGALTTVSGLAGTVTHGYTLNNWNTTVSIVSNGITFASLNMAANGTAYYPLVIPDDACRILSVTVYNRSFVGNSTAGLYVANNGVDGFASPYGAVAGATGVTIAPAAGGVATTLTPTTPNTVAGFGGTAGSTIWIKFTTSAGTTLDMYSYTVTYDKP